MARLAPAESQLVGGAADAAEALTVLASGGRMDAAMKLCAFALPRPEAVWWACICVTHTEGEAATASEVGARKAAELWVCRGDEAARYAAMDAARRAGFGTPHAWSAVAAFWCGGSMAPYGEPEVPPGSHLAGTAVHGAVSLAAVRGDPARRAARLERFLAAALDIADGGNGQIGREVT